MPVQLSMYVSFWLRKLVWKSFPAYGLTFSSYSQGQQGTMVMGEG